jgi:hypothetical protein
MKTIDCLPPSAGDSTACQIKSTPLGHVQKKKVSFRAHTGTTVLLNCLGYHPLPNIQVDLRFKVFLPPRGLGHEKLLQRTQLINHIQPQAPDRHNRRRAGGIKLVQLIDDAEHDMVLQILLRVIRFQAQNVSDILTVLHGVLEGFNQRPDIAEALV